MTVREKGLSLFDSTRRQFVPAASCSVAGTPLVEPTRAAAMESVSPKNCGHFPKTAGFQMAIHLGTIGGAVEALASRKAIIPVCHKQE
jgi:hypothetical protein